MNKTGESQIKPKPLIFSVFMEGFSFLRSHSVSIVIAFPEKRNFLESKLTLCRDLKVWIRILTGSYLKGAECYSSLQYNSGFPQNPEYPDPMRLNWMVGPVRDWGFFRFWSVLSEKGALNTNRLPAQVSGAPNYSSSRIFCKWTAKSPDERTLCKFTNLILNSQKRLSSDSQQKKSDAMKKCWESSTFRLYSPRQKWRERFRNFVSNPAQKGLWVNHRDQI